MNYRVLSLALAALLAPAVAQAEVTIMNQSRFWTAYTTTTTDGLDLCGIGTQSSTGRKVFLKWFKGSNKLVIQVFKPTWSIPAGVSAAVSVRFDNFDSWSARTVAPDRVVDFVEFNVPVDRVQAFVRSFTAANTMVLAFPGGSEDPWVVSLQGSTGAVNTMVRCMAQVNRGGEGQPYASVPNGNAPNGRGPYTAGPGSNGPGVPSQPFGGNTSQADGRPLPSLPPVQTQGAPPASGVKRAARDADGPPPRAPSPPSRGDDEELGLPK